MGKLQIKGKPIKSDLNLKCDLSFRKNVTTMRRIAEEVSTPTGGTNIISIKVSADYVISERISIRLFYDRIINKPVISTSFPTTNTNAGLSLRLSLSN
jgi:cell surface protein SprA